MCSDPSFVTVPSCDAALDRHDQTMRLPAAERREQLLRTAVAVFADKGFTATSMNDVAEAAGVTKPVLYQHFSSKRELFVEREG